MARGCGLLSAEPVETHTVPPLAPSGTRAIRRMSVAIRTLPSASPKRTTGCAWLRAANPLPWIWISPPGMAAPGVIRSMRGMPFFSAVPLKPNFMSISNQAKVEHQPQHDCGVDARHPVVGHDAPAARKPLEPPYWKRLPDIEDAKKYKTREQVFPVQEAQGKINSVGEKIRVVRDLRRKRDGEECQHKSQVLAGDFVNDDVLWILDAGEGRCARSAPNADERDGDKDGDGKEKEEQGKKMPRNSGHCRSAAGLGPNQEETEGVRKDGNSDAYERAERPRRLRDVANAQDGCDGHGQARFFSRRLSSRAIRLRFHLFSWGHPRPDRRGPVRRPRNAPPPSSPGPADGSARCKKGSQRSSRNPWELYRWGSGASLMLPRSLDSGPAR